jgi:hypothetical protein
MRKVVATFSFALAVMLTVPGIASAAALPKVGATCSKLNQSVTSHRTTFVCVKSGKKLIWATAPKMAGASQSSTIISPNTNSSDASGGLPQWLQPCPASSAGTTEQGTAPSGYVQLTCSEVDGSYVWVDLQASSSANTSSNGANGTSLAQTTTNSSSSTSSSTPTSTSANLNFDNLYAERRVIAEVAWTKIHEALTVPAKQLPPIETYSGPHTIVWANNPEAAMSLDLQLLPNAQLPKKVVIIYWSHADMAWAVDKAQSLMGADEYQKIIGAIGGPFVDCYTPKSCNVGHAYIASDGTAYLGLGEPDSLEDFPGDTNLLAGSLEATEFYHALDLYPHFLAKGQVSVSSNGQTMSDVPPNWLGVGSENFTFSAIAFGNDEQGFINSMHEKNWIDSSIHNFSTSWLNSYLDLSSPSWYDSRNADIGAVPPMGQELMEILIAIKGPSVMLDFDQLMSQGASFPEAFQTEFGTSWQDVSPILAKVIYDKYQNNY